LFFNLSSKSRLDILQNIQNDTLRMNEIARKTDITATEASRQIQRLVEELIIQKQPDSAYILTNYGRLVLHFLPSLEFIFKHKQYFSIHDIWKLPYHFINRIGELSQGNLCTQVAETVNRIENMMKASNEYVWVLTDQAMITHSDAMNERISKGVKFRSLIHEKLIDSPQVRVFGKNVERRLISSIPALVVVTEKEAFFSLLSMDGKIDPSGFFGGDPIFMKWVTDLYLHYWDQTDRQYPKLSLSNNKS
jgi:predicted transcriptional regulator